jgi:membrane associated rhomboid family serine protease
MALRQEKTTSFNFYLPRGTKWLIIICTAIFIPYYLSGYRNQRAIDTLFALVPSGVIHNYYLWQVFTYMFLHAGVWHLVFNMLALWFFGAQLEQEWGTRRFVNFFILCGVAAGFCVLAANAALGSWYVSTIGSSGAIFGILVAFGVLFPDQTVFFWLLIPMKAKYMVMIFVAVELLMTFGPNNGVSTVAHLGGAAFGYLYLKRGQAFPRLPDFGDAYRRWKLARAKKRFQVYLRDKGGPGPWRQ